jgi:hypothetical protein
MRARYGLRTVTALVNTSPPITVSRVESATGWWEFARGALDPRLRGLVASRCGDQEYAREPLRRPWRQAASFR